MSYRRIILGVAAVFVFAGAGVCFGEPVIEVWPSELKYYAAEGGDNPAAQVLYISNSGTWRLDWEITEDCEWLSADPPTGEILPDETDEIEISINTAFLSVGEYSCELTISDPNASNSPQVVEVSLTVIEELLDYLVVFPEECFETIGKVGGPFWPGLKEYTLTNIGDEELYWGISWESDWLDVSDGFGSLDPDESVVITVYLTAETEQLGEGDYYDTLKFANLDTMVEQTRGAHLRVLGEGEGLWVPYDFPTIQSAIDAAMDGYEVIVADGTYTGEGNRDIDFLGKAITVRSATGAENCIIDCSKVEISDPNHRGFMFISGEDENSILDGFTITNGDGNWQEPIGGAIYCYESSPAITNCILNNNWANSGGGVYFYKSNSTISNCVFSNNSADHAGAGLYCEESNVTVTGCTFSDNWAKAYGGGIYSTLSNLLVTNCELNHNRAGGAINYDGHGSGIYSYEGESTITSCTFESHYDESIYFARGVHTVTDCTFTGNYDDCIYGIRCSMTIAGCAFTENSRGVRCYAGDFVIEDCEFIKNSSGLDGGGVYCSSCNDNPSKIINSKFISNTASGDGGALAFGGSDLEITNCIFMSNSSNEDGGALALGGSGFKITNCTFVGNSAGISGGSIYYGSSEGDVTLNNCILWNAFGRTILNAGGGGGKNSTKSRKKKAPNGALKYLIKNR